MMKKEIDIGFVWLASLGIAFAAALASWWFGFGLIAIVASYIGGGVVALISFGWMSNL